MNETATRRIVIRIVLTAFLVSSGALGSGALAATPTSWDWRDVNGVNYVSGVRHTGSCGSIYIFAPIAMVESRLMIEMGNLGRPVVEVDYSEQYIMACGTGYFGDFDCGGGYSKDTLTHMRDVGAPHESCYEYTGADQTCPTACPDASGPLVLDRPVTSVGQLYPFPSEQTLRDEIYANGPVAINFQVYEDLISYDGGVYQYVHGALRGSSAGTIVGWGSEGVTPYWIVKNAWGENWGEDGYFRVVRGGADGCDFAEFAWTCDVGDPVVAVPEAPSDSFLAQNRPNPFNPSTLIAYSVPTDGATTLRVYDVAGQLVRTLVDGTRIAGQDYEAVWNGRDERGLPSGAGVYFYRLDGPDYRETKRMLLIK